MHQKSNTNIEYVIEAKDRRGLWHPFSMNKITSRAEAHELLASNVDKLSAFYTEARINQIETKQTITTTTLTYLPIT